MLRCIKLCCTCCLLPPALRRLPQQEAFQTFQQPAPRQEPLHLASEGGRAGPIALKALLTAQHRRRQRVGPCQPADKRGAGGQRRGRVSLAHQVLLLLLPPWLWQLGRWFPTTGPQAAAALVLTAAACPSCVFNCRLLSPGVPPHLLSSLRAASPGPTSPLVSFPVEPSLDLDDCAGGVVGWWV